MRRTRYLTTLSIAVVWALASFAPATPAAEAALQLKWADLLPKNVAPAQPNKTFFAGSTRSADGEPPPAPLPEGTFMSIKRRQPGSDRPPSIVTELNGKHVQIGGYVVPLDFEATTIKEFLLVPFVGACIHVPPPPANQIVYVKVEKGFDVKGSFEPVKVVGMLKTEPAFTGLADAGYILEAESVQVIPE